MLICCNGIGHHMQLPVMRPPRADPVTRVGGDIRFAMTFCMIILCVPTFHTPDGERRVYMPAGWSLFTDMAMAWYL